MLTKKEFPTGTVILFLSFIVLMVITYSLSSTNTKTVPQELVAVLRPHTPTLRPFTLIDQHGQLITRQNLKGKWNFVFFGYTFCPDVCPTTLTVLKQVNKSLKNNPEAAANTQVIFVSVDPVRDTQEILAKYIAYFNQEFIALTGTADNLLGLSRQFGAAFIKEKPNAEGDYLISHTSSIFLVDPQTNIVASFSPPHYAETISSQYLKIHDMFK